MLLHLRVHLAPIAFQLINALQMEQPPLIVRHLSVVSLGELNQQR